VAFEGLDEVAHATEAEVQRHVGDGAGWVVQQGAGVLDAEADDVLQGGHAEGGLEVAVERRAAHAGAFGQLINGERAVEVAAGVPDGVGQAGWAVRTGRFQKRAGVRLEQQDEQLVGREVEEGALVRGGGGREGGEGVEAVLEGRRAVDPAVSGVCRDRGNGGSFRQLGG
jgi:hypothetical protein